MKDDMSTHKGSLLHQKDVYMLRDAETGYWSQGGIDAQFVKEFHKGKKWKQINHIKNHLNMLLEHTYVYSEGLPMSWEIVVITVTYEAMLDTTPILEFYIDEWFKKQRKKKVDSIENQKRFLERRMEEIKKDLNALYTESIDNF